VGADDGGGLEQALARIPGLKQTMGPVLEPLVNSRSRTFKTTLLQLVEPGFDVEGLPPRASVQMQSEGIKVLVNQLHLEGDRLYAEYLKRMAAEGVQDVYTRKQFVELAGLSKRFDGETRLPGREGKESRYLPDEGRFVKTYGLNSFGEIPQEAADLASLYSRDFYEPMVKRMAEANVPGFKEVLEKGPNPGAERLVATGAFVFISTWADFVVGFIMTSSEKAYPLSVAIARNMSAWREPDWGLLNAAGLFAALVPVLVAFALRGLVSRGRFSGAVKG